MRAPVRLTVTIVAVLGAAGCSGERPGDGVATTAAPATAGPEQAASGERPASAERPASPPLRSAPEAEAARSSAASPARAADPAGRAEADALRAEIELARRPADRRAAIDRYRAAPGDDPVAAAEPLLRSVGSDPDPVVRRWAALALERRAEPALAPALEQAWASEPDGVVKEILARAVRRARRG